MLKVKTIVQVAIASFLLQGCIPMPDFNKSKTYLSDKPVVMFILDTSGSMNEIECSKKRIETAKASIIDTINKIDDRRFNTSLLTFKGRCGTNLLVSPNNSDKHTIVNRIKNINASGGTPLAGAIAKSGEILKNIKKKTVVLLSDGMETCFGNPIVEAKRIYKEQGINIDFQVIGYAVDPSTKKMLKEISNISPTWKYHDAKDGKSVDIIINDILRDRGLAKDGWDGNIYAFQFSSDSTQLTFEYIQKIDTMYSFLKDNNDDIIVTGYTDSRGSIDYNKKLSLRRANMVKNQLIKFGISRNRIKIQGMGEDNPIATNSTKDGRRINRRVTIETIKRY